MHEYLNRVRRYRGTPHEIGFAAGRALGPRLEATVRHYLAARAHASDMARLHAGALPWLRRLPVRFQEELEGMAEGAGLPLQLLAEWSFIEECEMAGCSAAAGLFDGRAWIARNNDTFVPELWGYATIREATGRIPSITFSMESDVFAPTGINRERLWLHYNYLSVWDEPRAGKRHLPGYVFVAEALEVCRTIADVEALLREVDRDGGMLLFAVDGKTDEFAAFECLCSKHYRRDPVAGRLVGTNHYCACEDLSLGDDEGSRSSLRRFARLQSLVADLTVAPRLPTDLIAILGDAVIERRTGELITAYANVACPATGELWYTFGGYPAASAGDWQRLAWPWGN